MHAAVRLDPLRLGDLDVLADVARAHAGADGKVRGAGAGRGVVLQQQLVRGRAGRGAGG